MFVFSMDKFFCKDLPKSDFCLNFNKNALSSYPQEPMDKIVCNSCFSMENPSNRSLATGYELLLFVLKIANV